MDVNVYMELESKAGRDIYLRFFLVDKKEKKRLPNSWLASNATLIICETHLFLPRDLAWHPYIRYSSQFESTRAISLPVLCLKFHQLILFFVGKMP